ncbi:hypothetical protein [Sphingosinicella sp.]|uniref:hypothetical protein n=1 Tax=Sphingosinicella sp. TaxID=1917971 RepID=UPI004037CBB8
MSQNTSTNIDHYPVPAYLAFLPAFAFELDDNPFRYIWRAALLATVPAILIVAALMLLFPLTASAPDRDISRIAVVLGVVVIGPIVETALLGVLLMIGQRVVGPGPAVVVSALLWGVIHGSVAVRWGIAMSWSFLIFSTAFVTWRQGSVLRGFGMAFAIHALQNGFAVSLLLALEAI